MSGKVKVVTTEETAVNEIDRATSPYAYLVNRFEEAPPGQEHINIIPTAYSF